MLTDYIITEDGAFRILKPKTLDERGLVDYITYSPDQLTLGPGESAEVHYSFTLPTDATGPHWAALIVTPKASTEEVSPPESEEEIGLMVDWQICYGYCIIQRSPNPPPPVGRMVAIDVSGGTTEEGGQYLGVGSTFENMCDDILTCQVYMEVRDEQGEAIVRYDFPRGQMVYPRARQIFSHTFEDVAMPAGKYLILCVVDFGGDHLAGAQYMATVGEAP
jgi:hypothetical protein